MAMNIGFLVIGIILSTLSKWLQVQGNDELGDLLVFPAAFFLGLALVTSFPFFKDWWREPSSRPRALRFASLVAQEFYRSNCSPGSSSVKVSGSAHCSCSHSLLVYTSSSGRSNKMGQRSGAPPFSFFIQFSFRDVVVIETSHIALVPLSDQNRKEERDHPNQEERLE